MSILFRSGCVICWSWLVLLAWPMEAVAQEQPAASKSGSLWEVKKGANAKRRGQGGAVARRESFVRYQVVGGGEKRDTVVTVRGDGVVKLKEDNKLTKEGRLPSQVLKQLILQSKRLDGLESVYGEKSGDPFQKTTTLMRKTMKPSARRKGGSAAADLGDTETVTIYHDGDEIPVQEIHRLVEQFEEIIKQHLTAKPEMRIEFHGIAAAGMIDRFVYPLLLKETPKASDLWLHLSLANFTDETLPLSFLSGQSYEIRISDEEGKEMLVWSEGKEFEPGAHLLSLRRDWLSFVERVPLVDRDGAPLPAGRYHLKYEFLCDPPFRGETVFKIEEIDPKALKESFKGLEARNLASSERKQELKARKNAPKRSGNATPAKGQAARKADKQNKGKQKRKGS